MYNKVIMAGNLTKDIEIRYSQSGTPVGSTAIASNRKITLQNGEKKEEVCFIDIAFFGRTAEVAHQYLHRGSKILIEGRLSLDQWTDQYGKKQSKHSIVVESMQMLGSKQGQTEDGSSATDPSKADSKKDSPDLPSAKENNQTSAPFRDDGEELQF